MWSSIMHNSDPLLKLKANGFRRGFGLGQMELMQLQKWGWPVIREHAERIVKERLSKTTNHDKNQTPYKGHPVFVAQHATATCCRDCLFKWHRIPQYKELGPDDIRYCVTLILRWIIGQEERAKSSISSIEITHSQKAVVVA